MPTLVRFVGGVLFALALPGALLGCSPEAPGQAPVANTKEAVGLVLGSETEPNNAIADATTITSGTVVRANMYADDDTDYYRFTAQAGDRVYAATQTSFAADYDGTNADTRIGILAANGTTIIEEDDDNGTFFGFSSSIAGAALPSAGTYFVRVTSYEGQQIRPYDLHFRLRSGSPASEAEPNDVTGQAIASGWVSGAIASATDVDLYTVNVNAGDSVFASLDLDPERNGTTFNGALGIGPFGGTFVTANTASGDFIAGADSEAAFATPKNSGPVQIRVTGAAAGNYQLSVTVYPGAVNCQTYTSNTVVPIPDSGFATATLTVPDDVVISDLNVNVQATHTFASDLDFFLIAPGGNQIGVFSDAGGSNDNIDVTIDDEAALPTTGYPSPVGVVAQPNYYYRLHWLDGQRALGNWSLRIWDDSAGDTGSLTSWGISICSPPPPPACPSGTVATNIYATNFEADAGNFTHSGTLDQWARGLPSGASAPITTCNSGTSCFKTNLTGPYALGSTSDLRSPAINLAGVQAPIIVRWAQKYQLVTAALDRASIDVRRTDGTNATRLFEFLDDTMADAPGPGADPPIEHESAGWGIHTADISSYVGNNIELLFHHEGNDQFALSGLAIDDVSVIACVSLCGNGVVNSGEQCDDGNRVAGDCCSATCQYESLGSSCADTDLCDGAEACNGAGVCAAGTPVTCTASDQCHTVGVCATNTGVCSNPTAPNGTPCSLGMCQSGTCTPGSGGAGGGGAGGGSGGAAGGGGAGTGGTSGAAGTGGASGASSGSGGASSGSGGLSGGAGSGGSPQGGEGGAMGGEGGDMGGEGGSATGGSAGAGAGGVATGGTSTGGATTGGSAGSGAVAGAGGTAGNGSRQNDSDADESSGCGCAVPGRSQHGMFSSLALAALVVFAGRRRARRSAA